MSKLPLSRWIIWLTTALLFAACVMPPPAPPLPPQPALSQPRRASPVLIPTHTPGAVRINANSLTLAQQQLLAGLPALGAAPELQNETWLNSAPLQLAALRGKVVMVEFWTYG